MTFHAEMEFTGTFVAYMKLTCMTKLINTIDGYLLFPLQDGMVVRAKDIKQGGVADFTAQVIVFSSVLLLTEVGFIGMHCMFMVLSS